VPDLPGCGLSAPPEDGYSIAGFATTLWSLLSRLQLPHISIVGFSMGGAVALEMALQRPQCVSRLALINSLASYRDHWRKWVLARSSAAVIHLLGMRKAAQIFAAGLFPEPWQQLLRERAADVISAVPAASYLAMSRALERWDVSSRLRRLNGQTLVIAAENDHTPLAEKRALAAALGASMVVVNGSRHGTPFDSSQATNESLLGLLTDERMAPFRRLGSDMQPRARAEWLRLKDRLVELLHDDADLCDCGAEGSHNRLGSVPAAQELPGFGVAVARGGLR
jgi:3-oxoadipate enol-lactonase